MVAGMVLEVLAASSFILAQGEELKDSLLRCLREPELDTRNLPEAVRPPNPRAREWPEVYRILLDEADKDPNAKVRWHAFKVVEMLAKGGSHTLVDALGARLSNWRSLRNSAEFVFEARDAIRVSPGIAEIDALFDILASADDATSAAAASALSSILSVRSEVLRGEAKATLPPGRTRESMSAQLKSAWERSRDRIFLLVRRQEAAALELPKGDLEDCLSRAGPDPGEKKQDELEALLKKAVSPEAAHNLVEDKLLYKYKNLAVPALIRRLDVRQGWMRDWILSCLRELRCAAAVPAALHLIESRNKDEAEGALAYLLAFSGEIPVKARENLGKSSSREARIVAAALSIMDHPESVPDALEEAAIDGIRRDRIPSSILIGAAEKVKGRLLEEFQQEARWRAQSTSLPWFQGGAALLLSLGDLEGLSHLARRLDDADQTVRLMAAFVLRTQLPCPGLDGTASLDPRLPTSEFQAPSKTDSDGSERRKATEAWIKDHGSRLQYDRTRKAFVVKAF